jgi:tetratricopeptide (TPR) repeat protein
MKRQVTRIKRIVAAGGLAVGFSLPVGAQDGDRMADLMGQLATADNARAAERVIRAIVAEWSKSGSATVDLLLRRGVDALEAGDHAAAVAHLTAAIDEDPGFAEALYRRATAYYLTGEIGPALDDLRAVLVLNPAHFGALQGFAVIVEELGRKADALMVYEQVLDINPQDADVAQAVRRLTRELGGTAL